MSQIAESEVLRTRTKKFALAIIRLCESLPKGLTAGVIGKQLIRSGTSVGANYRAACCGKSKPDFIAKLPIVHEEIDECLYWLELLVEANLLAADKGEAATKEASELLYIVIASLKTARSSLKNGDGS